MAPYAYTADRAQVVLTRIDRGQQVSPAPQCAKPLAIGGEPRGGVVFLHHINQRFPVLGSCVSDVGICRRLP